MKKRVVALGLFILFIGISFVSAETCIDSDGGMDYYVKGKTTGATKCADQSQCTPNTVEDICGKDASIGGTPQTDNSLQEFFCSENYRYVDFYDCPNGCYNGACIESTCTDSDGGKNYYVKGITFGEHQVGNGSEVKNWTDYCIDSENILEFSCRSLTYADSRPLDVWSDSFSCPNGCLNGECISKETVCCEKTIDGKWCQNTLEESCDINFRKTPTSCEDTSYCKETVCCEKTIDGKWCQNTLEESCDINFRKTPTSCEDTSYCKEIYCSVDATNCTGLDYNEIIYGIISRQDVWNGNNFTLQKVCIAKENEIVSSTWSFEQPNCAIILEIDKDLRPSYEKNETEPVEIPGGAEGKNVSYICSGCLESKKCYPFNYRKSGKYCSMDNEFINQLEAKSICDNNFECKSNVCVNSECISGSLIARILGWFRRIFGGE